MVLAPAQKSYVDHGLSFTSPRKVSTPMWRGVTLKGIPSGRSLEGFQLWPCFMSYDLYSLYNSMGAKGTTLGVFISDPRNFSTRQHGLAIKFQQFGISLHWRWRVPEVSVVIMSLGSYRIPKHLHTIHTPHASEEELQRGPLGQLQELTLVSRSSKNGGKLKLYKFLAFFRGAT